MPQCMLTTKNNPYNPFESIELWRKWDIEDSFRNGRRDCDSMLALFSHTSDSLSEADNHAEIERAIEEIIKYDPLHIYVKAVEKT